MVRKSSPHQAHRPSWAFSNLLIRRGTSGCVWSRLAPIQQVPVVGARGALDLDVPLDRGTRMACELSPGSAVFKDPMAWADRLPVADFDPAVPFLGMPTDAPAPQGLEQHPVELAVDLLRDDPRVEVSPAGDDRVERLDHRRLRGRPLTADFAGQLVVVPGLCVWAGSDERLEPQAFAMRISPGSMPTNPILAYVEPEKVEAHGKSVLRLQRMTDTGLLCLQFKTNGREPFSNKLPYLLDDLAIFVQYHEVVCIDYHQGLPTLVTLAVDTDRVLEGSPKVGFKTMQGHVGK